ncbi:hypothetical protein COMA2_10057 [Candidatus Nitrospira nitrificans]|uniref:Uncharacterized protein n=1 Tax=Candidatus Nitrospira nitrificans TaxID=1742973 RepID=A0A0S4L1D9_9BACT|nr:hypothetical protein COMA2_10057 [Candidatus Nitrospira nitrificans]
MIKISNNTLEVVKGLLSFFKGNTMLLLVEDVFLLIPFKLGLGTSQCHIVIWDHTTLRLFL